MCVCLEIFLFKAVLFKSSKMLNIACPRNIWKCESYGKHHLYFKAVVGNRRPMGQNWPAIISGQRPQPDYFDIGWFWNKSVMTATVTHNQSMWAEQSAEGGSVILTGARRGFFISRRIVVFTRSKSTPPPLHHEYNSCQRPII